MSESRETQPTADNPRYEKAGKSSSEVYLDLLHGRATSRDYVDAVNAEVAAEQASRRRTLPPHDPSAHENLGGPEFFSVRKWLAGLIPGRRRDA